LRSAIVAAVIATGQFDASTDELVSVVLEWHGAAYGGVASVDVPTSTAYLPPQSNTANFLKVEDAANNKMVIPHTIEQFGLAPTLVVQGYHYSGSTGLRMLPATEPIVLNGQMSNYPLIGGANCHSPADETDPAWLEVCLRQFVKHYVALSACAKFTTDPGYFWYFETEQSLECWTAGTIVTAGLHLDQVPSTRDELYVGPTGASGFEITTSCNTTDLGITFAIYNSGAPSTFLGGVSLSDGNASFHQHAAVDLMFDGGITLSAGTRVVATFTGGSVLGGPTVQWILIKDIP